MVRSLRGERSTEAPMDFHFTSRPSSQVKPVWAVQGGEPSTPRKRTHDDSNPPPSPFLSTTRTPTFGGNMNQPFLFQISDPKTPQSHAWAPPSDFSPSKAFPQPHFQNEVRDIDMVEASPLEHSPGKTVDNTEPGAGRLVALGGMKRTLRSRRKSPSKSSRHVSVRDATEDDTVSVSDDEDPIHSPPINQALSNHYTLNMSTAPIGRSDLPYILLGYLQFFFNLSLVLVFLYLLLQFILTVQRDVQQRISEHSMDIVQEIAMCASQYRNNLCGSNPIPAMIYQCASWETCMNRDPAVVGRAKVAAELIAEIVNGFVEPISWKTLAFTLTSLSFLTLFINALLSLYRSRHVPHPTAPAHQPSFPVPPATPYGPNQFGGYLSPAPTPSWGRHPSWRPSEDLESPTRRRRLETGGIAKIR